MIVSIGVSIVRNIELKMAAKKLLMGEGSAFSAGVDRKMAKMNVLDAVSPKRDTGA